MWQASKHGNYAFEAIMRMRHVPNHGKFVTFYFKYRKSQQGRNVARSVSTSTVTMVGQLLCKTLMSMRSLPALNAWALNA
jgi:hypothetical protein